MTAHEHLKATPCPVCGVPALPSRVTGETAEGPTLDPRVTLYVPAAEVGPGLWNGDENSLYAIQMDGKKGPVWVRSRDWATYGRMYGFDRVAVVR